MTEQLVMEHSDGIQDHEIWKQVNTESTSNLLQHEHTVKLCPDSECKSLSRPVLWKKQSIFYRSSFLFCNKHLGICITCWRTDIYYKRNIQNLDKPWENTGEKQIPQFETCFWEVPSAFQGMEVKLCDPDVWSNQHKCCPENACTYILLK